MAKLIGRTKGLDKSKLSALEKILTEAGISGNVNLTSGLRDHDEVFRIYNQRIRREGLQDLMDRLSPKSKDLINQSILRTDYKGQDKPVEIIYGRNKFPSSKVKKQLMSDGVPSKQANSIISKIMNIRKDFGGFQSSHLVGGKVDIPQSFLSKEVVEVLRDKGYKIIKEDKVGIYDISFPESSKKASKSESKPKIKLDLDDKFIIPKDKALVRPWMKKHGYKSDDLKKSDGSWYHPGDTITMADTSPEVIIPGEENVEKEWEQFKEHLIRDPYYGTEVDIPKAELPEPEIKPKEMPLDMGIEWEEEQLVAAKGGEVKSRGYNEGGYVDSWRQPPVEEVDEEMVTKQTAEMVDPDEDIIGQMSIEEIEETRESIPLDDPRRDQLNNIISKKKHEQENPEDYIDDRPTGAADSTPLPVKFQSQGQTTYPGEEPAPWDEVKDVDDTTREWSETSSVSGDWGPDADKILKTPSDKTIKEGPSKEELTIKQDMKAVESQQDFLRTQRAELDNEIKKYMDDELELTKIDPERFWKNKGTLDKIVAIVGQAAGAYHSARFKTKNLWKEDIDKAIDQDIAAQKLDNLNTIKMKNAAYKRIQLMTDRYKNLVSDDQAQQKLDMMKKHYAGIRMKNLKEYFTAKQESKAHRMLNRPLSTDEMNALSFKYPKQKIRERAIMGRDGKFYLAADESEARKLRSEVIPEAEKAINAAAELTQLTKDIGFLDKMNPFSEKKAQAKTLRESLKGALRLEIFGPGVMTDTERKIADQVVGNPNKMFTMDKTEIAKLETLMGKLNYGIRQRLRRSGLNFPPSQNEQRIKQLLALRKQKDIPQNRKKIVDDLVRSQQKAEKIGSKKVFWIFNEPLPI